MKYFAMLATVFVLAACQSTYKPDCIKEYKDEVLPATCYNGSDVNRSDFGSGSNGTESDREDVDNGGTDSDTGGDTGGSDNDQSGDSGNDNNDSNDSDNSGSDDDSDSVGRESVKGNASANNKKGGNYDKTGHKDNGKGKGRYK